VLIAVLLCPSRPTAPPNQQEPTHHGQRGTTTWAHPFDFYPELCPLPGAGLLHHKPFSVGCLATATGAWSEVTQVCSGAGLFVSFVCPLAPAPAAALSTRCAPPPTPPTRAQHAHTHTAAQVVDVVAALSARGIPAATADWLLTAGLSLEFSVLVAGG
jgi:hypothetical protein